MFINRIFAHVLSVEDIYRRSKSGKSFGKPKLPFLKTNILIDVAKYYYPDEIGLDSSVGNAISNKLSNFDTLFTRIINDDNFEIESKFIQKCKLSISDPTNLNGFLEYYEDVSKFKQLDALIDEELKSKEFKKLKREPEQLDLSYDSDTLIDEENRKLEENLAKQDLDDHDDLESSIQDQESIDLVFDDDFEILTFF